MTLEDSPKRGRAATVARSDQTATAAGYLGPQQCREIGITVDAVRASPSGRPHTASARPVPLAGVTIHGGEDSVVPCDAARAAPPLWRGQQLRTAAANVASGRALRNARNV